jgi:hypothetical protein
MVGPMMDRHPLWRYQRTQVIYIVLLLLRNKLLYDK